jgi:hypothetical protein
MTSPQYRPYQRQMPVHRRVAAPFGLLRFRDPVNQRPVDRLDFLTGQKRIEPAQLALVFLMGGLVSRLLEVSNNRVFPIPKLCSIPGCS